MQVNRSGSYRCIAWTIYGKIDDLAGLPGAGDQLAGHTPKGSLGRRDPAARAVMGRSMTERRSPSIGLGRCRGAEAP